MKSELGRGLASFLGQISAFPVKTLYFHETFHDKWCEDKSVEQTENGLERGFAKHWLNCVKITGPKGLCVNKIRQEPRAK